MWGPEQVVQDPVTLYWDDDGLGYEPRARDGRPRQGSTPSTEIPEELDDRGRIAGTDRYPGWGERELAKMTDEQKRAIWLRYHRGK